MSAQANTAIAKVAVNASEDNRQWKHDHGGFKVWIETKTKLKLTTMLRKSEKSVVLLLQQDHPWRKSERH